MAVELCDTKDDGTIMANEMLAYQLAEIVSWSETPNAVGAIVERCRESENNFIRRVGGVRNGWVSSSLATDCRVRVLPNGTHLVVLDNE